MRLIDANAIPYNYTNERGVPMTREIDIQNMPTIEKRKTGRWSIKEGELAFWDVCSECKKMVMHKAPFYNYCPNCGARMENK